MSNANIVEITSNLFFLYDITLCTVLIYETITVRLNIILKFIMSPNPENTENKKEIPVVKAPPFYSPLLWPFANIWEVIKQPSEVRVRSPVSLSTLVVVDHCFALVASFRSFLVAYAIVYWLHDDESPYPAWERGL